MKPFSVTHSLTTEYAKNYCNWTLCSSYSGTCSVVATSFYRAMHFSAKRGIAIACRLSVCPSLRLCVCNVGGL